MCKCSNKCNCNITSVTKGAKGDVGSIGATGATGPAGVMVNGWKLDGNTEGSQKYFGTNDNFSIPIYTNGVSRGVFDNSGNFGFGISSALGAKLHIKGADALASSFSLKVDNLVNESLLSISNDGRSIFGYGASILGSNFGHTFAAVPGYTNVFNVGEVGLSNSYFEINTGGTFKLGNVASDKLLNFDNTQFWFTNANVGIGIVSPTARLHIKGVDAISSNFALKVDNGAVTPFNIIQARNDGYVIKRAVNAPILDADLANNELSSYINEAGNLLIFKVKYSTGVVKTTSLALI